MSDIVLQVMEFPADDGMSLKKPGRRSQPRNNEDGPGLPCEECGKEFR